MTPSPRRHDLVAPTAVAFLFSGSLFLSSDAQAVGTRTFDLDTLEEFAAGELKGTSVGSDAAVRASWGLSTVPLADATASFSALRLGDGSALVGTSPNGKVFRIVAGAASVFADTGALAVTSLVEWKGAVYAGTIPDGKIFKLSPGKAELFLQLPETSHVWALAVAKDGGLLAATGPEGKLFRIDAGKSTSVLFRSDDSNLVSLCVAPNGEVLVGSSGKGILYRVSGPGKATALADFPGEEVKGIAVGKNGHIFAIANEYGEPPEVPKRTSPRAVPGPSVAPRAKPGKGSLWRLDTLGKPERMMKHDEFHYLSLAMGPDGRPYVGTGAEGRIYSVDDAHAVTLVADTDERQVSAFGFVGKEPWLASSDPATFHRGMPGAADATWTTKVLDAGLRARFGQLSWTGSGVLEVSSRTGNTAQPDLTWSGWSEPMAQPGPATSPLGRFVQVRVRWRRDPDAVLRELLIPFVTDNVRPVVLEVTAQPKTGPKETHAGLASGASEVTKHEALVKISWRVENPDSDTLRYRVNFRRDGQAAWRDLTRDGEVLTKTELDWDTSAVPDGKYRVRVEASDEPSNPPDQVQKHALESGLLVVDNGAPVITELTMAGRKLHVRVVDALSSIGRVEVAFDGRPEWHALAPRDGVFDTRDEMVDSDVSSKVGPGPHIVAVRGFDVLGNNVTREIETP